MVEIIGVLIPVFALMIPIVAIWTRHKQQMAQMRPDVSGPDAGQYEAAIRRLDDRVQVLERIITDRGYDVAAQIEALRGERDIGPTRTERTIGAPMSTPLGSRTTATPITFPVA